MALLSMEAYVESMSILLIVLGLDHVGLDFSVSNVTTNGVTVLLPTGQKNITTNVTRHAVAHAIGSLSLFCFGIYPVGQLSRFLLPPKGPFTLEIYYV